jgi:alpha-ketoglutarate-dependent taurine dioxygenase
MTLSHTKSSTNDLQTGDLQTRPLLPNIGVEVIGHDFSVPPGASRTQEILALADRHLVLLFRNQRISETEHVKFTEALGPIIPPVEPSFASTTNPMLLRLGNIDMSGNKLPVDSAATQFTYAPERWHSDGSYKPIPNYLSILHALEIPPVGGETWFASMAAAYEALSDDMKAKIGDLRMEHPYPNSGKTVEGWQGRKLDVVVHPLVRQIPGGQKALFVSPFGGQIVGIDQGESDRLVRELLDFATSGSFTYKHQWRLGDTLMWNNRGLVHTARPWDRVAHRRLLQRTEISDAHGYAPSTVVAA